MLEKTHASVIDFDFIGAFLFIARKKTR